MTVGTFKIDYYDGASEDVEAHGYADIGDGTWLQFVDGAGTQILRVRASEVVRVERVKAKG